MLCSNLFYFSCLFYHYCREDEGNPGLDVRQRREVKSLAGWEDGTKKLNNAASFYNSGVEQTKIREKEVTGKDPLSCETDTRKQHLTPGNKHGLIKSIVKRTFDCDDENIASNANSSHKKSATIQRLIRQNGKSLKRVVLPKLPIVNTSSKSRRPSNVSPWHDLLSQASRHFRAEDAKAIHKIKRRTPQAK